MVLTTIEPRSAEMADLGDGAASVNGAGELGRDGPATTYALVERAELPLRPDSAQALFRVLGHQVRDSELADGARRATGR